MPALLAARCADQRHKYRLSRQPREKSARSRCDHFFWRGESEASADADFGPEVGSFQLGLSHFGTIAPVVRGQLFASCLCTLATGMVNGCESEIRSKVYKHDCKTHHFGAAGHRAHRDDARRAGGRDWSSPWQRFGKDERRSTGLALLAVGVLTTIPIVLRLRNELK